MAIYEMLAVQPFVILAIFWLAHKLAWGRVVWEHGALAVLTRLMVTALSFAIANYLLAVAIDDEILVSHFREYPPLLNGHLPGAIVVVAVWVGGTAMTVYFLTFLYIVAVLAYYGPYPELDYRYH